MVYLLGIIVLGLLALARKSKPASNKQGLHFNSSDNTDTLDENSEQVLKVASYNIQTGKSNQGVRNIWASAKLIAQADLIGIQEVYAPSLLNLLGLGRQQTECLASVGRFDWLFAATRRRWLREHRGNAVLSRLKVTNWRIQMLPDWSNKSYRNLTVAELEWQGKTFCFINTHLHTKKGRDEQLKEVLDEFAKHPRAILVGDFNTDRSNPVLQDALKDIEVTDAIAVTELDPNESQRIDWILVKGFTVFDGYFVEKGISDHPYYQVSLRLT